MRFTGLVAAIVLILAATLLPWSNFVGHSHWNQVQWAPFDSQSFDWFDFAANVALFVPFGHFAGSLAFALGRKNSVLLVLFAAALLSLCVELMQIYSHSRFPSASDVSCNVLGAALGALLAARQRPDGARNGLRSSKFSRRKSEAPIDA